MKDLVFRNRSSLARPVFDEFDKIFNEVFAKDFFPGSLIKSTYPKMNVYDCDSNGSHGGKCLCIDAYVPEVGKDKLRVSIENEIITLSGDSEADKRVDDDSYYFREVSRRSFSRSVHLPDGLELDKVTAEHKDGMLKISIPYSKKETKTDVKSVKIN